MTVVLAVAALVVYVKGVRYDKSWATPVMTLLVLGAVVAVILPRTPQWRRRQMARRMGPSYESVEYLAEKLAPQLSDGARVLVLRDLVEAEMMELEDEEYFNDDYSVPTVEESVSEISEGIARAFRRGAGFDIEIVANVPPKLDAYDYDDYYILIEEPTVGALDDAIAPYEDDLDLIISMINLPGQPYDGIYELEYLAFYDWANVPLFAWDAGRIEDSEVIRNYIEDGLLAAVAFRHPDREIGLMAVSQDNLGELPEVSPHY